MLSYQAAIAQILERVAVLPSTETPLEHLLGRVLAEDIVAPISLPPFANSAMDGYAVRAEDVRSATPEQPIALPVTGEVPAGASETPTLAAGTALRIMTGAPLPPGADAVVPVEDTDLEGATVRVRQAVTPGRFVREAGEDVIAGTTVVTQDSVLRPAEIGLCAAVGRESVMAYPRPRVAVISTGDELVPPGRPLQGGQIYNSNAYALAAQVADAGGEVIQRLHAADTPEALREAFDACAGADVLLTSGGVSVGQYDHVKSVFAERGTVDFWRVAIRPGKPLAFGTWGPTLFFGLPGNPVSSMVTFELFVRPALRKLQGRTDLSRPVVQARLTEDASHEPGRRSYQRAFVTRSDDGYAVHTVGGQGSHQMRALVLANGLLILPDHVPRLYAGEFASVLLLDSPLDL